MARQAGGLVAQIQNDALDDSVPLATALRKCLVLGGESGSRQLLEWATRELEGYEPQDDLPAYRVIHAPLFVDGIAGVYKVTHQQFPASSIPDFAREAVSERLELRYAIGALEAMLGNAEIMLQPPHASDLVRYMNAQAGTQIVSLYWGVAHSEVRGVLDQVRTALTRLVVELRANLPDTDAVPTAEAANQAVNVIVSGESHSIQITTAQTAGADSPAQALTTTRDADLAVLLEKLEAVFRETGDAETAEKVSHVATLAETPHRDGTKLRKLWAAIKVAATTNEAVTLVNHIAPLLLGSGPHQ